MVQVSSLISSTRKIKRSLNALLTFHIKINSRLSKVLNIKKKMF